MDEDRYDAKLHPPDRQPGEAASAARAKRRAIVAADPKRQAVLAKSPLKTRADALDCWFGNPQLDQETAEAVRRRQRIDPLLVAGAKPALEVRAPLVVRLSSLACKTAAGRAGDGCRFTGTTRPARLRMLPIVEAAGQASSGAYAPSRTASKLAWPHIRKPPPVPRSPSRQSPCPWFVCTASGACERSLQPLRITALLALAPFVKRVAADPVAAGTAPTSVSSSRSSCSKSIRIRSSIATGLFRMASMGPPADAS